MIRATIGPRSCASASRAISSNSPDSLRGVGIWTRSYRLPGRTLPALVFALVASCAGESDPAGDFSSVQQELSGTPGPITNCTTSQQVSNLTQALSRARQALTQPTLLNWLLEPQFEGSQHYHQGPND